MRWRPVRRRHNMPSMICGLSNVARLMRLALPQKRRHGLPKRLVIAKIVVIRAGQRQPGLRSSPRVEERSRTLDRNDPRNGCMVGPFRRRLGVQQMDRRTFIEVLACELAAVTGAVAQPAGKLYRIGYLTAGAKSSLSPLAIF